MQLQPLNAVAWHALGTLLLADGAPHDAVDALRCAQALLAACASTPESLQWQGGDGLPARVQLDLMTAVVAGKGTSEAALSEFKELGPVEWADWPWAAQAAAAALADGGDVNGALQVLRRAMDGTATGSEVSQIIIIPVEEKLTAAAATDDCLRATCCVTSSLDMFEK